MFVSIYILFILNIPQIFGADFGAQLMSLDDDFRVIASQACDSWTECGTPTLMNCAYQLLWKLTTSPQAVAIMVTTNKPNCVFTGYYQNMVVSTFVVDLRNHKPVNNSHVACKTINECAGIVCNNLGKYCQDCVTVVNNPFWA